MKKLSILPYIFILSIISCKSEIEKQNDLLKTKSDSLFSKSIAIISERFSWMNVDSIKTKYATINEPKEKLDFAKELEIYTKNKVVQVDRILEVSKINDDKLRAIEEAQNKIEEINAEKEWKKSKAGRIQKKHPNWSKEDCVNLANNKVWIGMSIDMLKSMRGQPDNANPSNYGHGTQWQWCWNDLTPSCFYGKDDGIITSYN